MFVCLLINLGLEGQELMRGVLFVWSMCTIVLIIAYCIRIHVIFSHHLLSSSFERVIICDVIGLIVYIIGLVPSYEL